MRDPAPQLREKIEIDGIRLDTAEEILANKLCALLSRSEVRDLVDVMKLSDAGLDPVAAVPLAARKDAGMTASILAWVLSTFPIPESAVPAGIDAEALRQFRDDLVRRLVSASFPAGQGH